MKKQTEAACNLCGEDHSEDAADMLVRQHLPTLSQDNIKKPIDAEIKRVIEEAKDRISIGATAGTKDFIEDCKDNMKAFIDGLSDADKGNFLIELTAVTVLGRVGDYFEERSARKAAAGMFEGLAEALSAMAGAGPIVHEPETNPGR
jgi:hypothetical protein